MRRENATHMRGCNCARTLEHIRPLPERCSQCGRRLLPRAMLACNTSSEAKGRNINNISTTRIETMRMHTTLLYLHLNSSSSRRNHEFAMCAQPHFLIVARMSRAYMYVLDVLV